MVKWCQRRLLVTTHYEEFLGNAEMVECIQNPHDLFTNKFTQARADFMIRRVEKKEIKDAMFEIGEDKAPGPDGFTFAFFKSAWNVVGDEVCMAIEEFFANGKLLREINSTIIALIPKVSTPTRITDYRPISCLMSSTSV